MTPKNYADVAELADALDLGSSIYDVEVQVLSSAPFIQLKSLKLRLFKYKLSLIVHLIVQKTKTILKLNKDEEIVF
jgi:predicted transcriptional regulator